MAEEFKFDDYHRDKTPPTVSGRKFARSHVKVAGTSYRAKDAELFLRSAENSQLAGRRYGITLRPEPNNPHDPNAVVVEGYWEVGGLLGSKLRSIKIGYLPADFAKGLGAAGASNLVLAAQLKNGWIGDEGGIAIDIAVYITLD
jgi:hypothetical protein